MIGGQIEQEVQNPLSDKVSRQNNAYLLSGAVTEQNRNHKFDRDGCSHPAEKRNNLPEITIRSLH